MFNRCCFSLFFCFIRCWRLNFLLQEFVVWRRINSPATTTETCDLMMHSENSRHCLLQMQLLPSWSGRLQFVSSGAWVSSVLHSIWSWQVKQRSKQIRNRIFQLSWLHLNTTCRWQNVASAVNDFLRSKLFNKSQKLSWCDYSCYRDVIERVRRRRTRKRRRTQDTCRRVHQQRCRDHS